MTSRSEYLDYVEDELFAEGYRSYQRRYANAARDSDRVLIEMVKATAGRRPEPRVLDVGCSTGNLLRHLHAALPDARLTGGDLMDSHLDEARSDPALADVDLRRLDLLDLGVECSFDVVIANAVIYLFDEATLGRALSSVSRALRPDGAFVAFDFVHGFEQELAVRETSVTHPDGLTLHMRSERGLRRSMKRAGLRLDEVRPFRIGVDLARPDDPADIGSHTVVTDAGQRMLFRGALFQPWAHIVARRPA